MKKRDGRLRRRIDSVLQAGMGKQILALLACNAVFFALFLFLCGELGYGLAVGGGGEAAGAAADSLSAADRLWFLYNNYIDTGNQVGVPRKERWAALLISLFGSVFVSGLLISTLSNIIERRVERCRSGRVHYRMRDHYVLIGTDAMLPGLILQLFGRDRKCQVVVQTIKDVEEVRRKLFSHLPHAYERRIAFCYARRDSLEELEALGVADAREAYILGDSGELDDIEYYHDSLNVDCLNLIGHICRAHGRAAPLRCHLLMEYRSTFSVFQFSDIAPEGTVWAVEFSPRSFRDLVTLGDARDNVVPILADATRPDEYSFALDHADVVYSDVAQKGQADILADNMDRYGATYGIVCVKARSEDVTADPEKVFSATTARLRERGMRILDSRRIDPYEKDHMVIVVRRPRTVYAVAFDADGRFLMVRHPRRNGWEMPGGKTEAGETVQEAAAREFLEESGHRISVVAVRDIGYCDVCAAELGEKEGEGEMEARLFDSLPDDLSFGRDEYMSVVPWARDAVVHARGDE